MKKILLLCTTLLLLACSSKPIPFTDYLVENLLRENLLALSEPPLFSVANISITQTQTQESSGSAHVDVRLSFLQSFASVVEQRQLTPESMEYQQYRNSFGDFAAGEEQVHHAEYQFQRRDGKWFIVGSRPVAAPDIFKADSMTEL
jgi:hypothetical protein